MPKDSKPAVPAAKVPEELEALELYRDDANLVRRWDSLMKAWKAAYPKVDILKEIRKAHLWEMSNRAKTARGRPEFLRRWLERESNAMMYREVRDKEGRLNL